MEDKKVKIITHDQSFHIDELFAVATLDLLLGVDYELVRTRDKEIQKTADYIVDTGGEYLPEENKFDHHQEGGAGKRENGIPYSSFGLVWKKFGSQVCGWSQESADIIDKKMVVYIDAEDNGIDSYTVNEGINVYSLPKAIKVFRPQYEEDRTLDEGFAEALIFIKRILEREIFRTRKFVETKSIVKESYERSQDKRIIVLDEYVPAITTLMLYDEPLFAVVPRIDGKWMVRRIEKDKSTFDARKAFPDSWAGKTGEDLVKVTGVKDALFCHHSGKFICIAESKEGALKLANIAVNA